jgi:hypothetical protein
MGFGSINTSPYPTWIQAHEIHNQGLIYPSSLNPNGGNVGIGTTSPAGTLDVRGGVSSSGHGSNISIYAQNAAGGANWNGGNIVLMNGSGTNQGQHGTVAIGTTTTSGKIELHGGTATFGPGRNVIISAESASPAANWNGGHIILTPGAPGGSGVAGNVGIGSTSPTAALDVSGDIKVSGTIAVESWNTPTFENGWTNYGGGWEPAGYYKDTFGMVHLKGLVKSGTLSTAVFTLPVGSRPNHGRHIATLSANGHTACILYIYSNGSVVPAANCSSSWTSLEISFKP